MQHHLRYAIISLIFLPLLGCIPLVHKTEPVAVQHPQVHPQSEATGLVLAIESMAVDLLNNLQDGDPFSGDLSGGMVVTTFVETSKLTRTSSFGRYLSEQLMNEFQRHAYPVIEIRKSTELRVQEKRGEFGLARTEEDLQADLKADTMLTGTYFIGLDDILVTARILNNRTATVMASSTMIFQKNKLTSRMLADTASARTNSPQTMYLEKLEL